MSYQPIENYGVISDLNTVALVGMNGSIDFMCYPDFDSPTVFAALLDDNKGGRFSIRPQFSNMKTKQLYLPDTNVLLTRFLSEEGISEITDFMTVGSPQEGRQLVRRASTIKGSVLYRMEFRPRFNYAESGHRAEQVSDHEILFHPESQLQPPMRLVSTVPLQLTDGDGTAEFSLSANETADFTIADASRTLEAGDRLRDITTESLFQTLNYWKTWLARSTYKGRWREMVNRSALVLKMLTSDRYGSIVAAPTFGLPEAFGGERNWDYRYTWIRDTSFVVYSLMRLGYVDEATRFIGWIEKHCRDIKSRKNIGIMYALDGNRQLDEKVLTQFEGYRRSYPVTIGNDAYKQLQLDIYGELLNAVYLYNHFGESISYDFWTDLQRQMEWLWKNWKRKDDSIWEVRGGARHFLYSRIQSWVAFDRAAKIARDRSFPGNPEWIRTRDEIFHSIFTEFWSEKEKAFVQYPGATSVDASCLIMPTMGLIGPKDPRWLSTLRRVEETLISDSLVYRYNLANAAPDGFTSKEGTFSMCTFWYVDCLARAGQVEKAQFYFEKMLGYANHLGLFAEQIGLQGEHLGNFPQAIAHSALINTAVLLNEKLDELDP